MSVVDLPLMVPKISVIGWFQDTSSNTGVDGTPER